MRDPNSPLPEREFRFSYPVLTMNIREISNFDRRLLDLFEKVGREYIESDLKVVEVTLDLLEKWKNSVYNKLSDDMIHDKIALFYAIGKGKKRKVLIKAFKI